MGASCTVHSMGTGRTMFSLTVSLEGATPEADVETQLAVHLSII